MKLEEILNSWRWHCFPALPRWGILWMWPKGTHTVTWGGQTDSLSPIGAWTKYFLVLRIHDLKYSFDNKIEFFRSLNTRKRDVLDKRHKPQAFYHQEKWPPLGSNKLAIGFTDLLVQVWLVDVYYHDTEILFTQFKTEDHSPINSPNK